MFIYYYINIYLLPKKNYPFCLKKKNSKKILENIFKKSNSV